MSVGPALARALASGRARYNTKVAQARHRWPDFDTAAFAGFLRDTVDPLLEAVDAVATEQVHAVATAACDFAIELVARRLAGTHSHQPWVERAWREVAPRYARLLAAEPQALLSGLANAVVQLGQWPQVRVAGWLDAMQAHAGGVADLEQWRALGQLLAWRAGMAHYRAGALAATDRLPEALALAALDAPPGADWPSLRAALLADPWHTPHGRAHGLPPEGMQIGAFSGFGGPFLQPPTLRVAHAGFLVSSGERHYLLQADIHGAVLLPATKAQFDAATPGTTAVPRGYAAALGWPAQDIVGIGNVHTLALATPCSHVIALFPRP